MNHIALLLLGMMLGFVCTSRAHAGSLFSIATAETLGAREVSLDVELDAAPRWSSPKTLSLATLQVGVLDYLTVGTDVRLTTHVALQPNGTVRLTPRKAHLGLAAGFQNIGVRSYGEQPFAVLSQDMGRARAHAGWTRDTEDRVMLGAEYDATSRLTLQADWINGPGNFLTPGAQLDLGNQFDIAAGYMIANRGSDGDGLYMSLGKWWSF